MLGRKAKRALSSFFIPSLILACAGLFANHAQAQVFASIPDLKFVKPFNGTDPLPQTVTVASVGTGFNFTRAATTTTGGSWLSIANRSFSGCSLCATPQAITVIVTTLPTMAAATYDGQIVFTSQSGTVSITVHVTLTVTAAASAYFDNLPGQMSFSLQTGGHAPPSQSIQIRNAGTGTLNWTLATTTSDGGSWLSVSSTSGTAPAQPSITLLPANLPGAGNTAGAFTGQLEFQTATGNVTIPVSVTVGADVFSQINVLNFTKPFAGADPLPQTLTVPSTGAAFNFTVSVSTSRGGSWLSVENRSFGGCVLCPTPQAITVIVTTTAVLAAGTYTGQVVFTSQNGAMAITVPVNLTVAPTGGTYFGNLAGQMSFSLLTNAISVPSQDLEIRNAGSGVLSWTATGSTADGGNWLSVSAPSGIAPQVISVQISIANLPSGGLIAGTFIGQLVFQTTGDSITVPVSVVVGAAVFEQINPINFTKVFAGPNPLPQTLMVASTGTNFNFTASVSTATGGTWLSVANRSFGGCILCPTPQALTVIVNASPTLAIGTYTGQVVLTSQVGNMSITVPVTLTVAASGSAFFDNLPGQLTFSVKTLSQANPPAQAIQIRNSGTGSLAWTLETTTSDGGSWLSGSTSSGTAPSNVIVSITTQNLPGQGLLAGVFTGNLLFRSQGGGSVAVPVTVTVGDNIFTQINGISFTMAFGGANPLPQTLTVASLGTSFNFTAGASTASGGSWLSVSNPSFNDCTLCAMPQQILAIVNAATIPGPGTYTGQIVFTAQNGFMAITVPVTLTVVSAGAAHFGDIPGQMSFSLQPGGGAPTNQSILIQNVGSGRLDWTLAAITSDTGNWLNVSAPSGTAPSSITVGITPSALPSIGLVAGTFVGQLLFHSSTGDVTVPVSVVVDPNTFTAVPALSFSKTAGGSNPASQTFSISSTGTNFNFTFVANTATGGNWLSVASTGSACALCTTPKTLSATANPSASLAAGIYVGQIFTYAQAGNLVMTIPVTLTIRSSGTGPGTATHFSVVPSSSTATLGTPIQFTVTALDSSNATVATYSDPVHFTSTDVSAALPPNATLVSGVGTFPASLVTTGTQSLTVTDVDAPSIAGTSSPVNVIAATGFLFVPITPCRVADTRQAMGPFGGPFISAGGSRSFTIPSSACGIPAAAQAFSLNVAVVPHSGLGFLTVWPTGLARPQVATLNSLDGRIKSNAAIVPAGTGGAISVFGTNDTDVILDINGYFVPSSTPGSLAFYPLTPCRLVDTRNGTLLSGSFATGQTRTLPILSSTCAVPATAQAYSLNFVAVPPARVGFLTAYPTGVARPVVATLNDVTGTVAANAAVVPAGTSGSIDVFASDATQLVVDINGYYAPPATGGLSLYNLPPCRVLDTRLPSGAPPITGQLDVNVLGSVCGGTPATQAYVFNATVVPTASLGFLTMWPQGTTRPGVATLNALDGAITNNLAVVPTSNTQVSAFVSDSTHLILDLFGYFAP
jgi:hypothetical protein